MSEINVNHWKRFGKNRAYANDQAGNRLGYLDLKTDEVVLEPGADAAAVNAALWAWRAAHPPKSAGGSVPEAKPAQATPAPAKPAPANPAAMAPMPPPPEPTLAEPAAAPEAPDWLDLADNVPGSGVRAEAIAEWDASKDRSKFIAYTARALNIHTQERAWRKGAEGEETVGRRLNKLREHGWYVLHSIPVGSRGSDIDHVAIGPGGVFTINSKKHQGGKIWVAKYQLRVNGQVVPYLRNAKFEAERTRKRLSAAVGFDVPVRSCVAFITGSILPDITIKQMPDDVMVLDWMDIPGWFKRRKPVFTPDQIEAVYAVARRSDTWV